ncbi:MAG: dicarboxylate/amino acid:cation symporter [Planctomycetota bacterium]|nr:dicarboxylate/amino acid:cation symporter [Planctomycetota bacterium]MDA1137689.1 dicarboxylate/amino acid:cation symporter [Planctomycetota bacterium]
MLFGILAGVILGLLFGGLAPDLAADTEILGKIFLNALKMIVVPLVILSMISGITGLGDLSKLGSIGWRTIAYYMITTGISVTIGMVLVNIIKPGVGLAPGENFSENKYVLSGTAKHTVLIKDSKWNKTDYDKDWVLTLVDQGIHGKVSSVTLVEGKAAEYEITVSRWEHPSSDVEFYVNATDGSRMPFRKVDGNLVSDEPKVKVAGTGVKVSPDPQNLQNKRDADVTSTLKRVILGMIPTNIFESMVNMDVLPLIVFSILFGGALASLGDRGKPAVQVIDSANEGIMTIVWWVMMVAPIGIFGLVAGRIGIAGGFAGFWPQLVALGKYSLTVVVGLAIHGFIVLPLILLFFAKRNPLEYARNMGSALLNAFSTASSSATLPLTMEGVEKGNGVSGRTASFVLPLGATVNMDGTALYEAVAAIFIAQVYGIDLGEGKQIIIFLTATLAAIGAAGIPEAGLVTMVIVLKAAGLPIEGIGLILSIDWLLDRFRTTLNVWGDAVGAAVIDRGESAASL